jgi:hypothetical protein
VQATDELSIIGRGTNTSMADAHCNLSGCSRSALQLAVAWKQNWQLEFEAHDPLHEKRQRVTLDRQVDLLLTRSQLIVEVKSTILARESHMTRSVHW